MISYQFVYTGAPFITPSPHISPWTKNANGSEFTADLNASIQGVAGCFLEATTSRVTKEITMSPRVTNVTGQDAGEFSLETI